MFAKRIFSNISILISNNIVHNNIFKLCNSMNPRILTKMQFHNGLSSSTIRKLFSNNAAKSPEEIDENKTLPQSNKKPRELLNLEDEDFQDSACEEDLSGDNDMEGKFSLKNLLYSDSDDNLLQRINSCLSPDEVIKMYTENKYSYKNQHFVQTIISLWDFKRPKQGSMGKNNAEIERIINDSEFREFLQHVPVDEMNPDEATCCYLYLNKIGIDASHPLMQVLIIKCTDFISKTESNIPLTALSRFCVAVNSNSDYFTYTVCNNVIPHIERKLKDCTTAEDLRLITISMQNICLLITQDILEMYKEKVKFFIRNGTINEENIKSIVKMLHFLNFPLWSSDSTHLIRELILILTRSLNKMKSKQLKTVFKIFRSQLEPAKFLKEAIKSAKQLYKESPCPEMFAYSIHFSELNERENYIKTIEQMIEINPETLNSIDEREEYFFAMFQVLRSLKVTNINVCNLFWMKVVNEIQSLYCVKKNKDFYHIWRHCYRYMHFNNNLGGTFRHDKFEREVVKILMEDISTGLASMIPMIFSRFSSFILAYGHTKSSNYKFPDEIVKKIEEMQQQLSVFDCLHLSRGIQIAMELRFRRKNIPPELASQLTEMNTTLNACAENHLRKQNLPLNELNCVMKSLINRRVSSKTHLYENALNRYRFVERRNLNSRLLKDICLNMSASNYLIQDLLEEVWMYILENKDYVLGETVEKVLTSSYNLGYTPKSEEALYWAAEILKRDLEYMSTLSVVQGCLALCFYKMLPEDLIIKIFNIEFIKRIEDEIQICYSKATYPEKVFNRVMQLNRAVCLDFPESQVPWFQQNYIEAQMSKQPVVKNRFFSEMQNLLLSIVKDDKLITCNHVTPYGYRIDFVICLDKNHTPIPPPRNDEALFNKITKIAILLLRLDSYCSNEFPKLRGQEQLRVRHLEMLGYKVVHVNLNDWNSMYMNIPGVKLNYLKTLLHIE